MSRRMMIVLAACLLMAELAYGASWPRILPFDRNYNFPRPQDMYLSLPIQAVNGKTIYILECASPENARARTDGFHAAYELECRLSLPGATRAPDNPLLTDGKAGTVNQAGFNWNQLSGDCYRYPDYGGQRILRLRNMRLIITATNVLFSPGQPNKRFIQGLTLRVQGFYDPTALGEFAAPSHYEEPKPQASDQPAGMLNCRKPVVKPAGAR